MSRSFGSSCAASRWAHSRSSRLAFIASSSASIDFGRPTNSGTTMWGSTTMSRSGSSGSAFRDFSVPLWVTRDRLASSSSRKIPMVLSSLLGAESGGLRLLLEHEQRLASLFDHLLADHALFDVIARRDVVHQVEHHVFEDRAQAARARLAREGLARHRAQRAVGEAQPDVSELEQLLMLLDQRFLRLGQDVDERVLAELGQRRDHGQPADELRDQPELQQILGLHLVQPLALGALGAPGDVRVEAHPLHADPPLDDRLEVAERAAAQEQNVRGVDLEELLLRVPAGGPGRPAPHRSLGELEQRLARAGRPEQQDVRLLELDLAHEGLALDPAVVVVHGHREDLLRALLPDHVFVEGFLDLARLGHARRRRRRFILPVLFGDDVVAELDALVADVDGGTGDELLNLALALSA